ncbi:glycosyltransferase family 2 protein [Halioxenophilus sp. WMMB6]|uniref:glycosyltransferase family 2 protein n=1 Tax=Halioxenophilus sp. WMMB6 TaxID=3073815 RepID=UPI00295E9B3D|nr:glycosyltransferase [Halioxenophilus sp. WMMB6]
MESKIGAVVIGRNEGERLKACLESILSSVDIVVYVDSGSQDGSVTHAESRGVHVVELDLSRPFSAGRARNEGFKALVKAAPDVGFVQFIDGDCQVDGGWLAAAAKFLSETPRCAIVCGRRKEKFPEVSIYNKLCDIEWDTPIGKAMACGGDFLARVEAFAEVGGFDPSVIAGEEPEMCFRLRERGWEIWRIDQMMTMHDAQMTRFKQWWLRAKRCGHAYGQGHAMHGDSPEQYYKREVRSAIVWGLMVPLILLMAFLVWIAGAPAAILMLVFIPAVLYLKVLKYAFNSKALPLSTAMIFSFFIVLAKAPELIGIITYQLRARNNKAPSIIEYK